MENPTTIQNLATEEQGQRVPQEQATVPEETSHILRPIEGESDENTSHEVAASVVPSMEGELPHQDAPKGWSNHVSRPGDLSKRGFLQRAHQSAKGVLAAVGFVSAGVMAPAPAQAGDFNKSAEKFLESVVIGAINSRIPGNIGLKQDPNGGDPVLGTKAPSQILKITMPENVQRQMSSMGLIYRTSPFYIASQKYPGVDPLTIGQNTLGVDVSIANEKAVRVVVDYVKDGRVWRQEILSQVDDEGKLKSAVLADQLIR